MASGLSRILARRLRETTQSNAHFKPADDDHWRQWVLDSVEVDRSLTDREFQELAQSSDPLAILIGTLIDNIPEALMIGFNAGIGHAGSSFLLAVFISNIPEAISSSLGMKRAGPPPGASWGCGAEPCW